MMMMTTIKDALLVCRGALIVIWKAAASYLWCLERSAFNSGEQLADMTGNRGHLQRRNKKPTRRISCHASRCKLGGRSWTKSTSTTCDRLSQSMSVNDALRRQEVLTCSVRLLNSCTALGKSLSIRSCRKVPNQNQRPRYKQRPQLTKASRVKPGFSSVSRLRSYHENYDIFIRSTGGRKETKNRVLKVFLVVVDSRCHQGRPFWFWSQYGSRGRTMALQMWGFLVFFKLYIKKRSR